MLKKKVSPEVLIKQKMAAWREMSDSMLELKRKHGDEALNKFVAMNLQKLLEKTIEVSKKRRRFVDLFASLLLSRPEDEWKYAPIFFYTFKPQFAFQIFNIVVTLLTGSPIPEEDKEKFLNALMLVEGKKSE